MRFIIPLLAGIGAATAAAPSLAQPMRASAQDRLEAFRGVREGNMLPLHVIRDRVTSRFPDARMIGADLIGSVYRVRLMRGSDVLMVDVDARSGQLLRCSGRC